MSAETVNTKYSRAESDRYYKELRRADKSSFQEILQSYASSKDVNKRVAAAHFSQAFDVLMKDNDIHVLKTIAEFSPKVSIRTTRMLLQHKLIDVRSAAAVSLAKCGALTDEELADLDVPIIKTLISRRLYLIDIARIYKHGDIKKYLNEELNTMSRRDHIDVKNVRDTLNAHPSRQGDFSFEVIDDLEEEYVPEPAKTEEKEEIDLKNISDETYANMENGDLSDSEENSDEEITNEDNQKDDDVNELLQALLK